MRVVAILMFAVMASAQVKIPGIGKGRPAKAELAPEFNREFYENLRNFAEGLYKQKERQDFRMKVDRQFEQLLREHGDRAFSINTSPKSEIKIILEDRFRFFTGLYDNLMIQELVNRIGQEAAPKWSEKLVTFKLLADPVPRAESLATGTIYITTGLVASLDNKAQLSYILAHEASHVAKEHWKTRVMIENAKEEYAKMKDENQLQISALGSLVGMGVGMAAGAAGAHNLPTALLSGAGGALLGLALARGLGGDDGRLNIDWNQFEEDEADEVAMKSMLDAKINVNEVPNLYVALDKLSMKDDRVTMGFWGNRSRMQERMQRVREFLKANKTDQQLIGMDKEFRTVMSELKRDNGILAYHYDMLDVARGNLEQAVDVPSPDPTALYYYAKILQATAKTDEDQKRAVEVFSQVIQRDAANHAYGAYLHRAISLINAGTTNDKKQAAELLELYIQRYGEAMDEIRSANAERLPPHMDTIADYMRRADVKDWKYSKRTQLASHQTQAQPQAAIVPVADTQPKSDPAKPAAKSTTKKTK